MITKQNTEQTKKVCRYCKKAGHVIGDCRKRIKKEQEQRNDPSIPNMKQPTSKSFAPCLHCQRTNPPPEKCWSRPSAANRPKGSKQYHPADNQKGGQKRGNLTLTGASSILKNPLN